jgi:hypothetical protein
MLTKNVQMAQAKLEFMNVCSIIATKAREKEKSDNFGRTSTKMSNFLDIFGR